MRIIETRVTDSGMYRCVATNIAGNFTQTVKLSVLGKRNRTLIYLLECSHNLCLQVKFKATIVLSHAIEVLMSTHQPGGGKKQVSSV